MLTNLDKIFVILMIVMIKLEEKTNIWILLYFADSFPMPILAFFLISMMVPHDSFAGRRQAAEMDALGSSSI